MTPKIIELKQAPVVLVELPERPVEVKDSYANGFIYKDKTGYIESEYLEDYCDWEDSKLVGILSDLTEVHFETIIPELKTPIMGFNAFPNFDKDGYLKTGKESFYSMLESENVYTKNPHGKKEPQLDDSELWDTPEQDSQVYANLTYRKDKWHEAQSRTIDPKRTVVLLRKGDVK